MTGKGGSVEETTTVKDVTLATWQELRGRYLGVQEARDEHILLISISEGKRMRLAISDALWGSCGLARQIAGIQSGALIWILRTDIAGNEYIVGFETKEELTS